MVSGPEELRMWVTDKVRTVETLTGWLMEPSWPHCRAHCVGNDGLRCPFSAVFRIVGSSHFFHKWPDLQMLATDSIKGEHLYVIPAHGVSAETPLLWTRDGSQATRVWFLNLPPPFGWGWNPPRSLLEGHFSEHPLAPWNGQPWGGGPALDF